MKKPLDARTLRAVSRRMRLYERSERAVGRDPYHVGKACAFYQASVILIGMARDLERKTKAVKR